MKLILTDCDGVLLNWIDAFDAWISDTHGFDVVDTTDYDLSKRYSHDYTKFDRGMINMFNISAAAGFLPPMQDSIKYVRKLHEQRGYIFRVITSFTLDPYAIKLREQLLDRYYGSAIDGMISLSIDAPKDAVLKNYKDSGLPWIEDKTKNANLGADFGLQSYLYTHSYNAEDKEDDDVLRVKN